MVGNKRGKKEKNKRKECGYVGGREKKREKKKRKKKGRRAHVCGEKKKRKKNYITIFSQYFYNKS